MSKVKDFAKSVAPTDSEFQVDIEGDTTKKRFLGDFSCKVMNRKERALAAKHEAFLNGEMVEYLDPITLTLHSRIAYLRFALTEFPKWWRESDLGYALYDLNIIQEVYSKVLAAEETWMRHIWGDAHIDELKGVKMDSDEDTSEEVTSVG